MQRIPLSYGSFATGPSTPPGVPIPYPNTGMTSDTTDGSKTVQISGKEVMLKNKSYYKKCTGDEAATKSLGMGVITHCIQGKTYFASWSSDVKIEGENVCRHFDMTNSNGQSNTNQFNWVNFESSTFDKLGFCADTSEEYRLVPYKNKRGKGELTCPKPLTGHHLVPGHLLGKKSSGRYTAGNGKCHHNTAPVMCALGKNQHGRTSHGQAHAFQDIWECLLNKANQQYPYSEVLDNGAKAAGIIADTNREDKVPLEPGDEGYDCVKALP
jgi:predicted DNA-binding WGR domain protein